MVYLHSEMINKTQPAARMLQKYVNPLLERLASSLVENVFGLEFLVDGQINGIIRVGYTDWRCCFGSFFFRVATRSWRIGQSSMMMMEVVMICIAGSSPLHRCGNSTMVCLTEPWHSARTRTYRVPLSWFFLYDRKTNHRSSTQISREENKKCVRIYKSVVQSVRSLNLNYTAMHTECL